MAPKARRASNVEDVSDPRSLSTKEEQRKLRNRLSQKAIRERRMAHIHHLEQQLASSRQQGGSERIDELLEENAKLREGLHSTRKKLLSISTTASHVADNIKPILHIEDAAEEKQEINMIKSSPEEDNSRPEHIDAGKQVFTNQDIDLDILDCSFPGDGLYTSMTGTANEPSTMTPDVIPIAVSDHTNVDFWNNDLSSTETSSGSVTDYSTFSANEPSILPNYSRNEAEINPGLVTAFNLNEKRHSYQTASPELYPLISQRVFTESKFSDHLSYIHNILKLSGAVETPTKRPSKCIDIMLHGFLQQAWPAMQYWFAVTNSLNLVRSVLWWQTTKSAQAGQEVPSNYTPTFLQSSAIYPSIIDWVPHSALRDLLILNYESYDLDQVICDMTDAYVVEEEDRIGSTRRQYYNLMDLVQRSLCPASENVLSREDYLVRDLFQKTRTFTTIRDEQSGRNRIHRFKIDPAFFEKYPGLFDASAMARGVCNRPVSTPSIQKPAAFTVDSVKSYMNLALQAKGILVSC